MSIITVFKLDFGWLNFMISTHHRLQSIINSPCQLSLVKRRKKRHQLTPFFAVNLFLSHHNIAEWVQAKESEDKIKVSKFYDYYIKDDG